MYEAYFGFQQRPFRATPDAAGFYPATSHELALARLLQALEGDEGLALLTGSPGLGKTLLAHALLERLPRGTASALLTNSHVAGRAGLLQALLYDLGLPFQGRPEQELRLHLTDYLLKNCTSGRRTVLLLDEAQHLTVDFLEEIRLLGNLEAGRGKALQVVLLGQPGLVQTLQAPELAALRQRMAARAQLEPFTAEEAVDYLRHQVRRVGVDPERVFTEEALDLLGRASQGVPRVLNQLAHQAFLLARSAETAGVDAEVALEALNVLGLAAPEPGPSESNLGLFRPRDEAEAPPSRDEGESAAPTPAAGPPPDAGRVLFVTAEEELELAEELTPPTTLPPRRVYPVAGWPA